MCVITCRSSALACAGCLSWLKRPGSLTRLCVCVACRPCWTCCRASSLRVFRLSLRMCWVRLPLLDPVSKCASIKPTHSIYCVFVFFLPLFPFRVSFSAVVGDHRAEHRPERPNRTGYHRPVLRLPLQPGGSLGRHGQNPTGSFCNPHQQWQPRMPDNTGK